MKYFIGTISFILFLVLKTTALGWWHIHQCQKGNMKSCEKFFDVSRQGSVKVAQKAQKVCKKTETGTSMQICNGIAHTFLEAGKNEEAMLILEVMCSNQVTMACADAAAAALRMKKTDKALQFASLACDKDDEVGCYNLACTYCRTQETAHAMTALEKSYRLAKSKSSDLFKGSHFKNDVDLSCLHENPSFLNLTPQ